MVKTVLCGVRNDDVADLLIEKILMNEYIMKRVFFTFWKTVRMLQRKNVILSDYEIEDYLDYRIIQVLIYVINEVFHRTLEQDHLLLSLGLIETKKNKLIKYSILLINYEVKFQYNFQ